MFKANKIITFLFVASIFYLFPLSHFALADNTPDWNIGFSWNGIVVSSGGQYDFPINTQGNGSYSWPGGMAHGAVYKGTLNNSTIVNDHFLGSNGNTTNQNDSWPDYGHYFVVIYSTVSFDENMTQYLNWFQNGTGFAPPHWGIIEFDVGGGVLLYTQVESDYPSRNDTQRWSTQKYGTGNYNGCLDTQLGISSIRRCGCAITSMVMLGRYYRINTGTDNTGVAPDNINIWLTGNGGYSNSGSLIWNKVIEYLGFTDPQTGKKMARFDFNYKTDWNVPSSDIRIDQFINSKKPVIAYSSKYGHYFVIDNKLTNTYAIKDPAWYNTKTLNDTKNMIGYVQEYNNQFATANLFTYLENPKPITASIHLTLASPAELLITDSLGRKLGKDPVTNTIYDQIPDGVYGEENPIITSDDQLDESTLHKTKVIYIPEPIDGNYDIKVIGTGSGEYHLYLDTQDINGSSTINSFSGVTQTGLISDYSLDYSSVPGEPTEIEKVVTISDMIKDVEISYNLGWITKKTVKNLFITELKVIQRLIDQRDKQPKYKEKLNKIITGALNLFIKEVEFYQKKGILNSQASELLINDTQYIIGHL